MLSTIHLITSILGFQLSKKNYSGLRKIKNGKNLERAFLGCNIIVLLVSSISLKYFTLDMASVGKMDTLDIDLGELD